MLSFYSKTVNIGS